MLGEILNNLIPSLLIILASGLVAGVVCNKLNAPSLVGYLLVGALIGEGGLGLVADGIEPHAAEVIAEPAPEHAPPAAGLDLHDLHAITEAGALFLLFAIGVELSLDHLLQMSKYLLIGGSIQMFLVSSLTLGPLLALGMDTRPAVLLALALALSSTVLVFRALAYWGHSATPHGRRAVGILLFQDVALVPLMLLVPMLTGEDDTFQASALVVLAAKSVLYIVVIFVVRWILIQWAAPFVARMRSTELVVLLALVLLGAACYGAALAGLTPVVGAFAAGLMMSGNRLTAQMDALLLPFRESFAALFFVGLGTLLDLRLLLVEPLAILGGLLAVLSIKTFAATIALRVSGIPWKPAAGMGLGLSQLGEFSFVLLSQAVATGLIADDIYQRVLVISIGSLILTPQLLSIGLRWTRRENEDGQHGNHNVSVQATGPIQHALVIGVGPIGRQCASLLETKGFNVTVMDLSPVNLHGFAQAGFHTVAGDAQDDKVLSDAGAKTCELGLVTVPDDRIAVNIVKKLREQNPKMTILVRSRYLENAPEMRVAGCNLVVSEEAEAAKVLLGHVERLEVKQPSKRTGRTLFGKKPQSKKPGDGAR